MQPDRQTEREIPTNAIRRRTELEAKLLAYRCGWLARDEIRIRKLERALLTVLAAIGRDDPMARDLIAGNAGQILRSSSGSGFAT